MKKRNSGRARRQRSQTARMCHFRRQIRCLVLESQRHGMVGPCRASERNKYLPHNEHSTRCFGATQKGATRPVHGPQQGGTLRCPQEVNEWKSAAAYEFMTQPPKLHFMHPDSVIHVFETCPNIISFAIPISHLDGTRTCGVRLNHFRVGTHIIRHLFIGAYLVEDIYNVTGNPCHEQQRRLCPLCQASWEHIPCVFRLF